MSRGLGLPAEDNCVLTVGAVANFIVRDGFAAVGAYSTWASLDGASNVAVNANLGPAGAAFDCRGVQWLVDDRRNASVSVCRGGWA